MAKHNLSKHKDGYTGDQKDMGRGPDVVTGEYDVVNVELTRAETQKGARKIRPTIHVLGSPDKKLQNFVDAKFWIDLWTDLSKNANAKKMTYMILAHGQEAMLDNFDPDDDEMIQKAISGRPYRISIEVKEREYKDKNGDTKTTTDVDVTQLRELTKEQRAVYNTPKWKELLPNRFAEVKVYEKKEGGGGGPRGGSETKVAENDPFDDGDWSNTDAAEAPPGDAAPAEAVGDNNPF